VRGLPDVIRKIIAVAEWPEEYADVQYNTFKATYDYCSSPTDETRTAVFDTFAARTRIEAPKM
jgi:hypothetical protein